MIDKASLAARLDRFREYLLLLDSIRTRRRDEFAQDPILRGAGERYLHLAMENALDIGNHIIAERGYPRPDTYAGVLSVLYEKRILPQSLYQALDGMAAFRNLLLHDYARLDHGQVHDVLCDKYPSLQELYGLYVGMLDDPASD